MSDDMKYGTSPALVALPLVDQANRLANSDDPVDRALWRASLREAVRASQEDEEAYD